MGQYYNILLGDSKGNKVKVYKACRVMIDGKEELYEGAKLLEHGYLDKALAVALGKVLMKSYKRVLWVGDYANGLTKDATETPEANSPGKLTYYERVRRNVGDSIRIPAYEEAWADEVRKKTKTFKPGKYDRIIRNSYFLVNKDKKEYLKLSDYIHRSVYQYGYQFVVINPLALLTAVGNTLGNGDYVGTDMDMVGRWAWNLIGLKTKVPKGFTEIKPTFIEKT